jgi:hypothetical protein
MRIYEVVSVHTQHKRTLDVFFGLQMVYEPFEHGVRVCGCAVGGIQFVAGETTGIFLFQVVGVWAMKILQIQKRSVNEV